MFEENLIRHCSPTLAGLKTGNMFLFRSRPCGRLTELMQDYNDRLSHRGVAVLPLRNNENSVLIYVFRPARLAEDLSCMEAEEILRDCGYDDFSVRGSIRTLKERFRNRECFPHEVGLFLGYPPEDVRGFIDNKGRCCKCCGTWKVYGDVEKALKCFEKFRKCVAVYYRQWTMGKSVETLTVSA